MKDNNISSIFIILFVSFCLFYSCQFEKPKQVKSETKPIELETKPIKSERNQVEEIKGMASFFADKEILDENTAKLTEEEWETVWIINGQKMTWGSKPIYVLPNRNTLDTIYYRNSYKSKWDTIVCNIKAAKSYKFSYNDCCGGFNVINYIDTDPKISFVIEKPSNKNLLCEYAGAGVLAKYKKKSILGKNCSSAMDSNIKYIKLSDIEIRKDDSGDATNLLCFYEGNGKLVDNDFYYKLNKNLFKFLYMPLENDLVTIIYNPKTKQKTVTIL